MTNIIDFANFRRGNVIETTSTIIKEEPIMTPIQTVGTIGRQSTFANLGTNIVNSTTVEEALNEANANRMLCKGEMYTKNPITGEFILVPNTFSTIPIYNEYDVDTPLAGSVTSKYEIIQDYDSFSFLDCVPEAEIKKVGLNHDRTMSYLIAKIPEITILGDNYENYLCVRNYQNGRGNFEVTICPLRIVCQNQFNIAFKESPNTITIRHSRQAPDRIESAKKVITAHNEYYKTLQIQANEWATTHVGAYSIQQVVEDLFPIKEDMKEFQKERMEELRHLFNKALNSNDNQNFKNSVWGMINAYSDYITHREPARQTSTAAENRFMSVTFDPAIMNNFIQLVQSKIAA